ncbi:MAG: hypothetical protein RL681_399 [Candidatus Parcubacteria bacterium]|jgi:hypothetical protein
MNQKGFAPIVIILAALGIMLLGVSGYFIVSKKAPSVGPVQCPTDAKLCPDGSSVGRTGPNCEFAACPDEAAGWKIYRNEEGGYSFKYPQEWNAATNNYNPKNALFGPGATGESGYGGVELSGTLVPGQSLKDFVKEFNAGVEAGSVSETETTEYGRTAIVSILPKASMEPTEIKSVSFEVGGNVFAMYLMYKTDFAKNPEDEQRLAVFDQMLSTLEFSPTSSSNPGPLLGGDKDVHGCIGSAGYSWCEAKQKCLRPWEEQCGISVTPTPKGNLIQCPMDAKLCPDGSSVGRTGPNCEFAPCPTTTQSR